MKQKMIKARKAKLKDSKVIFKWRNDELSQKMSYDTNSVPWDEHSAWYASSLESNDRLIFLCEHGSKKIAIVRFEVNSIRALVSINLSPEMRGKGFSKQCLSESIKHFKNEFPQVVALDAKIKPENIASQMTFKSIGFVIVCDDPSSLYFEYLIR
jgi:RimJ/RimL family protein N-acetyltransferase